MWNIGGGFIYQEQLLWLIDTLQRRHGLGDPIGAVHDCHQGMIWNGGRVVIRNTQLTKESALELIGEYNRRGIRFFLTFNNPLVEERHLTDSRCNHLLEGAYSPKNGVICASEALRNYIRTNYPDYLLIHSCVPNSASLDYYKRMQELYDLVVLSPNLNTNFSFIQKLDTSRLEILVNEDCLLRCPFREEHYQLLGKANIDGGWDDIEATYDFCTKHHGQDKSQMTNARMMSIELDVIHRLKSIGIKHFKIQGRTEPSGEKMRQAVRKYILDPQKIFI